MPDQPKSDFVKMADAETGIALAGRAELKTELGKINYSKTPEVVQALEEQVLKIQSQADIHTPGNNYTSHGLSPEINKYLEVLQKPDVGLAEINHASNRFLEAMKPTLSAGDQRLYDASVSLKEKQDYLHIKGADENAYVGIQQITLNVAEANKLNPVAKGPIDEFAGDVLHGNLGSALTSTAQAVRSELTSAVRAVVPGAKP